MSSSRTGRSTVEQSGDDPAGSCPHCGRSYSERQQAARTEVYCGACGKQHVYLGTKEDNAGTVFECHGCGELNVIPSPEGGEAA